jgi:aminocarboxymuconate-semialdehyde decarboxylase
MRNRRDFITVAAGATAGILVSGHHFAERVVSARQVGAPAGKRREAAIGSRRVKTVDLHAHCFVPEVMDLVKDTPLAQAAKGTLGLATIALGNPQRLIDMDAQGIDYQAINVNAWGYNADKALARDLVALQNERISQYCAKHPDRFVGMATVALQYPELAAEQLDHAVKKLGMRGAAIGGSVEGVELSDRKFDPFWAKAQELGIVLFMHPQPAQGPRRTRASRGKAARQHDRQSTRDDGVLVASDLRGHARSIPRPEDLRRARGGYLASYSGRSDALCGRAGGNGGRLPRAQEEAERVLPARAPGGHDGSSTRRDCGISSPRLASARSSTAPTIRSTGRWGSTSSSTPSS